MGPDDLRKLSRAELLERAERAGVARARTLRDAELVAEIAKRTDGVEGGAGRDSGWFGRARHLVANVVERGLHLPEAAELLRGKTIPPQPPAPPPLPTVTLAEIYVAQGYDGKALAVLDQVLDREPDHAEAGALKERILGARSGVGTAPPPSQVPTSVPPPSIPAPSEKPPTLRSSKDEAGQKASDEEPAADAADAAADIPTTDPPESSSEPRDDLVALATDPRTIYVYWELRPVSYARAQWREPDGHPVLRVLSVAPTDTETEATTRDLDVVDLVGDQFVRGLLPGSEVRLCLGWIGRDGFEPLAVARELQMPRDFPSPVVAGGEADPHMAAVLRAEASARAQGGGVASRAAARLRGYVAEPPSSKPFPSEVELHDAQIVTGRRVIRLYSDRPEAIHEEIEPFAGASDLYGLQRRRALGGASDLYGGASDLYGGASDLYPGANDLAGLSSRGEAADDATPPSSSKG